MPTLLEADRKRLDDIVGKMTDNGESEEDIRFVVDDFKGKYAQSESDERSYPGQLFQSLKTGTRQAIAGAKATAGAVTGSNAIAGSGLSDLAAAGRDAQMEMTDADRKFASELQQNTAEVKNATGFWNTAGEWVDYAGIIARNPGAAFKMGIQSAPNAIVSIPAAMAGRAAGGLAGAAAGLETGPGAVVTGLAGAFAGNAAANAIMEAGPAIYENILQATKGEAQSWTPQQFTDYVKANPDVVDAGLKSGLVRGGVIGAIDTLSMGLAGKLVSVPERAAASAGARVLIDAGINVADKAALEVAMSNPATKAAVEAAMDAARAGFTKAGNVGRYAGATALESASEGTGEALAGLADKGQVDPESVVQEMVGGFATGIPSAIAGKTFDAGRLVFDSVNKDATAPNNAPPLPVGSEVTPDDLAEVEAMLAAEDEQQPQGPITPPIQPVDEKAPVEPPLETVEGGMFENPALAPAIDTALQGEVPPENANPQPTTRGWQEWSAKNKPDAWREVQRLQANNLPDSSGIAARLQRDFLESQQSPQTNEPPPVAPIEPVEVPLHIAPVLEAADRAEQSAAPATAEVLRQIADQAVNQTQAPSDEEIIAEPVRSIIDRTKPGPERDEAIVKRRAAAVRIAATLKKGDKVIEDGGEEFTIEGVLPNGKAFVEGYGEPVDIAVMLVHQEVNDVNGNKVQINPAAIIRKGEQTIEPADETPQEAAIPEQAIEEPTPVEPVDLPPQAEIQPDEISQTGLTNDVPVADTGDMGKTIERQAGVEAGAGSDRSLVAGDNFALTQRVDANKGLPLSQSDESTDTFFNPTPLPETVKLPRNEKIKIGKSADQIFKQRIKMVADDVADIRSGYDGVGRLMETSMASGGNAEAIAFREWLLRQKELPDGARESLLSFTIQNPRNQQSPQPPSASQPSPQKSPQSNTGPDEQTRSEMPVQQVGREADAGGATVRDLTKPEQMTPEEYKAQSRQELADVAAERDKLFIVARKEFEAKRDALHKKNIAALKRISRLNPDGNNEGVDPNIDSAGKRLVEALFTEITARKKELYDLQPPSQSKLFEEASKKLNYKDRGHHRIQIVPAALAANQPVSKAAVDAYGITLPEGYVQDGELYVYHPRLAYLKSREVDAYGGTALSDAEDAELAELQGQIAPEPAPPVQRDVTKPEQMSFPRWFNQGKWQTALRRDPPEVSAPMVDKSVKILAPSLDGVKEVRGKTYFLPGYKGPNIVVSTTKIRGKEHHWIRLEAGGLLLANGQGGDGGLNDVIKQAIQRINNWTKQTNKTAWEMAYASEIGLAMAQRKPVAAEAVDTYYSGKAPKGYTKQGELYIYQPESTKSEELAPIKPPAKAKRDKAKTASEADARIAEQRMASEFVGDLKAEKAVEELRAKKGKFIADNASNKAESTFLSDLVRGGWDKALSDVQDGRISSRRADELAKKARDAGLIDNFTSGRFDESVAPAKQTPQTTAKSREDQGGGRSATSPETSPKAPSAVLPNEQPVGVASKQSKATPVKSGDAVKFKLEGALTDGKYVGLQPDGTYIVESGGKKHYIAARNLLDNNPNAEIEGVKYSKAMPAGRRAMPKDKAQKVLKKLGVPLSKVRVIFEPSFEWRGRYNPDGSIDLNAAYIGDEAELMDTLLNHENVHDAIESSPKVKQAAANLLNALTDEELDSIEGIINEYDESSKQDERMVEAVRLLTAKRPELKSAWARFVEAVTLAIKKVLGIQNLDRQQAELVAARILARGTNRVMKGKLGGRQTATTLYGDNTATRSDGPNLAAAGGENTEGLPSADNSIRAQAIREGAASIDWQNATRAEKAKEIAAFSARVARGMHDRNPGIPWKITFQDDGGGMAYAELVGVADGKTLVKFNTNHTKAIDLDGMTAEQAHAAAYDTMQEEFIHALQHIVSAREWQKAGMPDSLNRFTQKRFRQAINEAFTKYDEAAVSGNAELADKIKRAMLDSWNLYTGNTMPVRSMADLSRQLQALPVAQANYFAELIRQLSQVSKQDFTTESGWQKFSGMVVKWINEAIDSLRKALPLARGGEFGGAIQNEIAQMEDMLRNWDSTTQNNGRQSNKEAQRAIQADAVPSKLGPEHEVKKSRFLSQWGNSARVLQPSGNTQGVVAKDGFVRQYVDRLYGIVSGKTTPSVALDASVDWSAAPQVKPYGDGRIVIGLNPSDSLQKMGDSVSEEAKARYVADGIDEEMIHLADTLAMRESWIKSGRKQSFTDYLKLEATRLLDDLKQTYASANESDKEAMQNAIRSSIAMYENTVIPASFDQIASALLSDPVSAHSRMAEFVRQLVQAHKTGDVSETGWQRIRGAITSWLERLLSALKVGASKAYNGQFGPLLQKRIQGVEQILKDIKVPTREERIQDSRDALFQAEARDADILKAQAFADGAGGRTKTFNVYDSVEGASKVDNERNEAKARQMFNEAGIQVSKRGNLLVIDKATEEQGRKLLKIFEREIGKLGPDAQELTWMTNALRLGMRPGFEQFSPDLRNALFLTAAALSSKAGANLSALSVAAGDANPIAQNLQGEFLRYIRQQFHGEEGERVIRIINKEVDNIFEDDINKALADRFSKIAKGLQSTAEKKASKKSGGVYQAIQRQFDQPEPKTKEEKERAAQVTETINDLLEKAINSGLQIPEKAKDAALSPLQKLELLTSDEAREKIQQLAEDALIEARFKAGWTHVLNSNESTQEEKDHATEQLSKGIQDGETPDDADIEAGLEAPEFAHWKTIQDSWLGYDPTTTKLIREYLNSEVKGLQFSESSKEEKPDDTRIRLSELAANPDAEVERVTNALVDKAAASMSEELSPEGRARIADIIRQNVVGQIEQYRKAFIDRFLKPDEASTKKPKSASEQLEQLLNMGIADTPEYGRQPKFVALVNKMISQEGYITNEELRDIAGKSRAEKVDWMNRKFDTIVSAENIQNDPGAQAVVWSRIRSNLGAAERNLADRMLKGPQATQKIERTAEQKEADVEKARQGALDALQRGINAGMMRTSSVGDLASKTAVKRLLPNLKDLMKQVLETPSKSQAALAENFRDALMNKMGIDPAVADKTAEVFAKAFYNRMKEARVKALARIGRDHRITSNAKAQVKPGTPIWRVLEKMANTGGFDNVEFLKKLAEENGYQVPTEEIAREMKELSDKEQDLRLPTEEEKARGMNEFLKAAQNKVERGKLINQMKRIWAKYTAPLNLKTASGMESFARAMGEYASANLLAKPGFVTKQLIDVGFQHFVVNTNVRAIANAMDWWQSNPNKDNESFVKELGSRIADAYRVQAQNLQSALNEGKLALKGDDSRVNTLGIKDSIQIFQRMLDYADKADAKGTPIGKVQALLTRIAAGVRLSYRYASALDNFSGNLMESQMLQQDVIDKFRAEGKSLEESRALAKQVMGNLQSNLSEIYGMLPPDMPMEEKIKIAPQMIRELQYKRAENAGLAVDGDTGLRITNDLERKVYGWNEQEEGGPGMVAAAPIAAMAKYAAKLGPIGIIPVTLSRFSNAVAIGINRAATFAGGGFFPNVFEGSAWYRTPEQRTQRRVEAMIGVSATAALSALALSGIMRVLTKWPDDEDERAKWEATGRRPNTVEFKLGDDVWRVSLSTGPLSYLRAPLGAIGSAQDYVEDLFKRHAKQAKEAKKRGLRPPPKPEIDSTKLAMAALYGTLKTGFAGGRTAQGMLGNAYDYQDFKPEKMLPGSAQSLTPFAPAWNEIQRLIGNDIDQKTATFLQKVITIPGDAQKRNNWGQPVSPNMLMDAESILSGGTLFHPLPKEQSAPTWVKILDKTDYHPKSPSTQTSYIKDGQMVVLDIDQRNALARRKATIFGDGVNKMDDSLPAAALKARLEALDERAMQQALKEMELRKRR